MSRVASRATLARTTLDLKRRPAAVAAWWCSIHHVAVSLSHFLCHFTQFYYQQPLLLLLQFIVDTFGFIFLERLGTLLGPLSVAIPAYPKRSRLVPLICNTTYCVNPSSSSAKPSPMNQRSHTFCVDACTRTIDSIKLSWAPNLASFPKLSLSPSIHFKFCKTAETMVERWPLDPRDMQAMFLEILAVSSLMPIYGSLPKLRPFLRLLCWQAHSALDLDYPCVL